MDFFNIREKQGRDKLREYFTIKDIPNEHLKFSEDKFDVYDFELTSKTLCIGEIKDVHRAYSQYPNFMIDYNKIKHLLDIAKEKNRTALLVVFFTDYMVIWNVSDIGIDVFKNRIEYRMCTKTTANYGNRIKKAETYLFIDEAAIVKKLSDETNRLYS